MKTVEEVIKALETNLDTCNDCSGCTYKNGFGDCLKSMHADALWWLVHFCTGTEDQADEPTPVEEPAPSSPMTRRAILGRAVECVQGDRDHDYGGPEDSFGVIAELWNAYLKRAKETTFGITPADVAVMMALLKVARIAKTPEKIDSWIDLAGYAACGGEIAGKGRTK